MTDITASATHADLIFRLHVEQWWKRQAATCKDPNMKNVWATPQYKNAIGRELMTELAELMRRAPGMKLAAGIELQWGMPVFEVVEGKTHKYKLIMIPWKQQDHNEWPVAQWGEVQHGDAGAADTGPTDPGTQQDLGQQPGVRVPARDRRQRKNARSKT